jgi:hypothetical protein
LPTSPGKTRSDYTATVDSGEDRGSFFMWRRK